LIDITLISGCVYGIRYRVFVLVCVLDLLVHNHGVGLGIEVNLVSCSWFCEQMPNIDKKALLLMFDIIATKAK